MQHEVKVQCSNPTVERLAPRPEMICGSKLNSPRLHLYLHLPPTDPNSPRPNGAGLSACFCSFFFLLFSTHPCEHICQSDSCACINQSPGVLWMCVCVTVRQCEEHPETTRKETPGARTLQTRPPEWSAVCSRHVLRCPPLMNPGSLTHTRGHTCSITDMLIKVFNSS